MRAVPQLPHAWICLLNTHSRPRVRGWLKLLQKAVKTENRLPTMAGATGSWETLNARAALKNARALGLVGVAVYLARFSKNWYKRHIETEYGGFPNPHVRSNAFIIKRELFLEYCKEKKIPETKLESMMFESGRNSLSAHIKKMGGQLYVVGADNLIYSESNWNQSGTFRHPRIKNLIVIDNQTLAFESKSAIIKTCLRCLAWGRQ